ncbi:MAG TPA: DUF423 domain-containing protein [Sphingomonas sp.]|nr:DUF423 domain-containing protein [Sphingomonas sp.]
MLWLMRLAALSAAIAIAAGAFGAHRFSGKEAEWLRTGGFYQLIHAIAVLALARTAAPGPLWTLLGGSALFAATLYVMALGAPRWFGAITPIGGALMIAGWVWVAVRPS